MGPRHLSRGIIKIMLTGLPTFACFNGATASEPWNLTQSVTGNQAVKTLQWGHGI